MFNIDIVIPTLHRTEKLLDCITSIIWAAKAMPKNFITVYVYFSDEKDFFKSMLGRLKTPGLNIVPKLTPYISASSFWNTHLKENINADCMMYLNDDVLLDKSCIATAYKCMLDHFDDLDGVVGLYQENLPIGQTVKTAFGMIGAKFADRFPDRKVFCEDYKRFYLDKELEEYAESVNKLHFCKDAKLTHLHPAFDSKQIDATHNDVRKHLRADKNTYIQRKEIGYLWGADYERIHE